MVTVTNPLDEESNANGKNATFDFVESTSVRKFSSIYLEFCSLIRTFVAQFWKESPVKVHLAVLNWERFRKPNAKASLLALC